MKDILVGEEAAKYLQKEIYFKNLRRDVDDKWAHFAVPYHLHGDVEQFTGLSLITDNFITKQAEAWAHSCRKQHIRLYADDFESEFRYKTFTVAKKYDAGKRGFFFDYLRASIKNTGRSMHRSAKTKKRSIDHQALSLEEQFMDVASAEDVESMAHARHIVWQLERDPSLRDKDRQLLQLLKVDPDADNQALSDMLGLGHRESARRIRKRLCEKGRRYLDVN